MTTMNPNKVPAWLEPMAVASQAAIEAAGKLLALESDEKERREFETAVNRVLMGDDVPAPFALAEGVFMRARWVAGSAGWSDPAKYVALHQVAVEAESAHWRLVAEAIESEPELAKGSKGYDSWRFEYKQLEQERVKAEKAARVAAARQSLDAAITALVEAGKFYGGDGKATPAPVVEKKLPSSDFPFIEKTPARASYLVNGQPAELRHGKFEPVESKLPKPLPSGKRG